MCLSSHGNAEVIPVWKRFNRSAPQTREAALNSIRCWTSLVIRTAGGFGFLVLGYSWELSPNYSFVELGKGGCLFATESYLFTQLLIAP